MTTAVLKNLPPKMWVVRSTYTMTRATGVTVDVYLYGPYSKESTANAVVTTNKKHAQMYTGPKFADSLDPGYMTITVEKLETDTNWTNLDI